MVQRQPVGRNVRECNAGVSPVIGVILMVMITVVLAAVVYFMIDSLATPDDTSVRIGALEDPVYVNDTGVTMEFVKFSTSTRPKDIKFSFAEYGDNTIVASYNSKTGRYEAPGFNYTIKYVEVTSNAYINGGDYLQLNGLTLHTIYVLKMVDASNNDVIAEIEFEFKQA